MNHGSPLIPTIQYFMQPQGEWQTLGSQEKELTYKTTPLSKLNVGSYNHCEAPLLAEQSS